MLYVVATPIGNLSDITLRAIETLKAANFIIAENPRHTLKLLRHYEIGPKKMLQFAEHNEQRVLESLILNLKSANGALVTDAGTPGISDPGFRLVRAAIEAGIKVVPIPGPSAALAALSASGLPTDRFLFLGFAPRTENKLIRAAASGKPTESTIIFYDSPFRIVKTLQTLAKHFPEAKMVVARELTKIHEEFIRGSAGQVLAELIKQDGIKGEITVLISFK